MQYSKDAFQFNNRLDVTAKYQNGKIANGSVTTTNTTLEPQRIGIVEVTVVGVSGIGCLLIVYIIYRKRISKVTSEPLVTSEG